VVVASDPYHISRARRVDSGDTKVTVVRDGDGDVVARAFTDPSTVVSVVDIADGDLDGMARSAASVDPDNDGHDEVELELSSGVGGPSAVDAKVAEMDDATYNLRRTSVGFEPRAKTGALFATDCVKINDDEFVWRGCFERRRVNDDDPDHWYVADSSVASGHHEGFFGGLTYGRTAHRYVGSDKPVMIVKQKPEVTLEMDCADKELSFSAFGVGYGETFTACPEKIVPDNGDEWANSAWKAQEGADDKVVAAGLLTLARMANSSNSRLAYRIAAHEDDVCVSC